VNSVSEELLLNTIHEVVLDLRQELGEAPQSLSASSPPTTRSLLAYHAFSIAEQVDNFAEAFSLYQRALEFDTEFVDAYAGLAMEYSNLGRWKEYRKFAEEAYHRSSALSEQYRLMREIDFLDASYEFEKELDSSKRYLRLYPFDPTARRWLGWMYLFDYQDPVSAEPHLRQAYEMSSRAFSLSLLTQSLMSQGKADEIKKFVADFRTKGGAEGWAAALLLRAHMVCGDWKQFEQTAQLLQRQPGSEKVVAAAATFSALLATGQLAGARSAGTAAWRVAQENRDAWVQHQVGLNQAWLEMRQRGRCITSSSEQIEPARSSLFFLPDLAAFCVDAGLEEPLVGLIDVHEAAEKDSKSRFVHEELQFARGCLQLVRSRALGAREILEPLAHNSNLTRRHRILARTYEALSLWCEAAIEYEEMLRNPHMKWWMFENPALWILDQYRLARIFETLGDSPRAHQWYQRFLGEWKSADPEIPEVVEARKRVAALTQGGAEVQ
jgi:tetratricopeptide (TPR) repeat protein